MNSRVTQWKEGEIPWQLREIVRVIAHVRAELNLEMYRGNVFLTHQEELYIENEVPEEVNNEIVSEQYCVATNVNDFLKYWFTISEIAWVTCVI